LWVDKYRPETVFKVVGNEEAKATFLKRLKERRKQKAILLYGPAGVGKTTLVYAAAKDLKYSVIEMNASDARTGKIIKKIAGPVVSLTSLDEFFLDIEGTLLLFDEVDGIFGREDLGGVHAIVKIIKESHIPIIMTANNPNILKLRPITKASDLIKFREVRTPLIITLLEKICRTEGISAEREALESIAQNSQGDVRSAINDLQILCVGKNAIRKEDAQRLTARNKNLNVHQMLKGVFSATSPQKAWSILSNSIIKYDTLLLAIHDNLPHRYSDPENLAVAYEILSRADIFMGRIGKELWQLLPYVYELLAQSVAIAPKTYQPFNIIFPPIKFSLLNWRRRERNILANICAKIGLRCHVSKRMANRDFIPFLRVIFRKESEQALKIAKWLELDEKNLEYLRRSD